MKPELFDFESKILSIPDYPEPGVVFKDITPLLADPQALSATIDTISNAFMGKGITKVVGAEARGFIVGAPIAYRLNAGFVPARKPGKLPRETMKVVYDLEYGTDEIEMHQDALAADDVVLIVDDVLATGGTAGAKLKLCEQAGAKVLGFAFILELDFLKGRSRIEGAENLDILSLVHIA